MTHILKGHNAIGLMNQSSVSVGTGVKGLTDNYK